MKEYFKYCDVNKSLLSKPIYILGHDRDIEYFNHSLANTLNGLMQQMLVLDFEEIKEISRPERFVQNTFADIIEHSHSFPVIGININSNVCYSLKEATSLQKILSKRKMIFPLFDQLGNIVWLGGVDSEISEMLASIYWEGEIDRKELFKQWHVGAKKSKDLEKLIETNTHFFKSTQLKNGEHFGLAFDKDELSRLVRTIFEKRFWKEINKLGMQLKGHFNLPCGKHATSLFVTSIIVNNPQLVKRVAFEIIRRFGRKHFETIVSYSLLGLYLAKEISEAKKASRYIVTYGYPTPLPRFGEEVRKDEKVLIITDAISSGRSLSALKNFVNMQGGIVVGSIAVFDTGTLQETLANDFIFLYPDNTYPFSNCKLCKQQRILYDVDAFTSIPRTSKPVHVQTVTDPLTPSEFWDFVIKSRALRQGHWSFNGHHFSIFIETHKMLKNRDFLKLIAYKIVNHYRHSFDFVIYPSHESAFLLAQAVAEAVEKKDKEKPLIIPTSKNKLCNAYVIPYHYEKEIRNAKVLVLDDGANFGETLIGIHFLLDSLKPKKKDYCILLDRLTGMYRENVNRILGHDKLFSLFCFPYNAYHSEDCPTCKERNDRLIDENTQLGSLVDIQKQHENTKLNFIEGKWIS